MAVHTEMKSYRTKGNMGMIDVTVDFQEAVSNACRIKKIRSGKITIGPWQNLTLVECDTRDRDREIVFQVMGE